MKITLHAEQDPKTHFHDDKKTDARHVGHGMTGNNIHNVTTRSSM